MPPNTGPCASTVLGTTDVGSVTQDHTKTHPPHVRHRTSRNVAPVPRGGSLRRSCNCNLHPHPPNRPISAEAPQQPTWRHSAPRAPCPETVPHCGLV